MRVFCKEYKMEIGVNEGKGTKKAFEFKIFANMATTQVWNSFKNMSLGECHELEMRKQTR